MLALWAVSVVQQTSSLILRVLYGVSGIRLWHQEFGVSTCSDCTVMMACIGGQIYGGL